MKKHPVDVCSLYLIYFRGIRELRFDSEAENKTILQASDVSPCKRGIYASSNKISESYRPPVGRGPKNTTGHTFLPRQMMPPDNVWHLNNRRFGVTLQFETCKLYVMHIIDNQYNIKPIHLYVVHKLLIVKNLLLVLRNMCNHFIINYFKTIYKDVFLRMRQITAAIDVLSEVNNLFSGQHYYFSNTITQVSRRHISDCLYASVSFMDGSPSVVGLPFCAKNKKKDTFFTISTFVVSLRCAFVCSCASIAFFLGKPFAMVCLSLDNNSNTDNNNIDFQGDTGASFDRLYASVSLSKNGSSSGALLGDCLFCDSNY